MERGPYFQNALLSGDVPLLTGFDAQPVLDSNGRPKMIEGASALVAHLRRKDGTDAALRIVASSSTPRDWTTRYTALGQIARKGQFRRLPGKITPVQPQHWTPNTDAFADASIVTMDWISGPTLLAAVDRAAQAGNRTVLRALHKGVVQLWNDVQGIQFVHGDLSGPNIMVRGDGQLALVDLDTASWPDSPFGSPGTGSAGYRPPTHTRDALDRDAFAILVILVSLQVLIDSPGFWAEEGRSRFRSRGVFLFGENDLGRLASSPLFTAAQRSVSPQTVESLDALEAATQGGRDVIRESLALIPGIRMAPEGDINVSDAAWKVAPIVERMRAHYTDSWTPREADPTAPEGESNWQTSNWPRLSEVTWPTPAETSTPESPSTPPAGPTRATASEFADMRSAIDRKDAANVLRLWSNLQADDVAPMLALEVEAVEAQSLQRGIAEAARQKHDQHVVDLAAEAFYRGFPLDNRTRQFVREATERLEIGSQLEEALTQGDAETLAELALTGQLAQAGETDRKSLQQVLQAIELPQLRRALEADDDLLILEAVDDELFGGQDDISRQVAARVDLAKRRRDWLRQARAGLKKRNSSELLNLLSDPPSGAVDRLSSPERRRIRHVIEGRKALDDLDRALTSGNDAAVVSALNRVERAGARIPERRTWASIQEVLERMSVVDSLLAAAAEQPPDLATLTQLLPTVKAMGLHRDRRLTPELIASLELLLTRMAHVHRIRAAIKRDNDIAIVTAAIPDEHGAMELLTSDEHNRVQRALAARKRPNRTSDHG